MADDAQVKVRRQFGLILTLISHRFGLLKNEIFESVPEYHERYDPYREESQEALFQLFERDKREIRERGIVIETFSVENLNSGMQDSRYRIVEEDYDFPEDITFSGAEMTLLRLAAEAWRDGSLSEDSRHALTKLRSLGIPATEPLIGLAPRITTSAPAFEELKDILERNGVATFLYLKPGETKPVQRNAAPLALVNRRGLWYVLAHDTDVDAQRTFLLSRIVSKPKRLGTRVFETESADYARVLEAELDALDALNVATVWVEPGSDAAIRLGATYGAPRSSSEIDIHYSDLDLLADELTEFGSSVRVRTPQSLAEAMKQRFSSLAKAHSRGSN
jgi:proteasome accessory factor B